MESKISIVTLGVADLNTATKFYQQGLGFPLQENSNEAISFFALQGTWLSLFPKAELAKDVGISAKGEGFGGITLSHNVKSEKEVDAILELAKQAGAKIIKSATKADWGGYHGYFADLDGYLWDVAYNPFFSIA